MNIVEKKTKLMKSQSLKKNKLKWEALLTHSLVT